MEETFKYYYNDTEYAVILKKRITGKLVDSFKQLLRNMPKDEVMLKNYEILKEAKVDSNDNLAYTKILLERGLTTEQVYDFIHGVPEINEGINICYYELMRLITDIDSMPEELQAELRKPVIENIAFWENQEVSLKDTVDSFRSKYCVRGK